MTSAQTMHVLFSIGDVERDTGLPKETLRVWERRYNFPQPERDQNGERLYPAIQVQRLRLVKRLLDLGYRPGKIMHMDAHALAELGAKAGAEAPDPHADDPILRKCLALVMQHKMPELRLCLAQAQLQLGLPRFVTALVAPLTSLVGDAWAAGVLAVFEEHLFAEILQNVMRHAIFSASLQVGQAGATPRILLATLPPERHGLGLLMAEALFALEGAYCISLGVQTPLADIVQAARAQQADIVALWFSGGMPARAAIDNVGELQAGLGAATQVWVGGSCAALARRHLPPQCVIDLHDLGGALDRWRAAHATLSG